MAGASLLTLLDDIATILDDVAVMSKVAVKKTAGVLGDDLALNAQQVTGVKADRELPVVWAVAKGSFVNKAILVPAALAISAFLPWALVPLLMIGGIFLCYEGFEKVAHKFLHSDEELEAEHQQHLKALGDESIDVVQVEKSKVRGAVRTDFILSAEIIVITLGTVADAPMNRQALVLVAIALIMTIGVYGLVAGIVKMDDFGQYLLLKSHDGNWDRTQRGMGNFILRLAPLLMRFLAIAGTAAMFLVGGGIVVHGIAPLHHLLEHLQEVMAGLPSPLTWLSSLTAIVIHGGIGLLCGGLVVGLKSAGKRLYAKSS